MKTTLHHQLTTRDSVSKLFVALALALLTIGSLSCETSKPNTVKGMREVRGQTFSIWMPQHFELQTPRVAGFNQFCMFEPLKEGGKPPTLNLYEGFEPLPFFSTRSDKVKLLGLVRESVGSIRIGAFQGTEARGTDKNGNLWRELYLRQPEQIASLHIWYFEASKEKATEFDAILGTLELRIRR